MSDELHTTASPFVPSQEPPVRYRQPDLIRFSGRTVSDQLETVDYIKDTHTRIWYNCQMEGYAPHHHSAIEIIYCLENGYTVTAAQQTYNLQEGDILFIPPHMVHRLIGGVKGARFIMLFDPEPLSLFRDYKMVSVLFARAYHLARKDNPDLYHFVSGELQKAADVYFSNKPMWEINAYANIIRIYAAIGRDFFARNETLSISGPDHFQANFDKFADLISYIDKHYAEDLTLERAAEYVGFSKFHFSRLFKEYTGTTYYDHLLNRRIQAAQELLMTQMPVTDICYQTGFHSPTSFSRSFKAVTGFSPKEYRRYSEQYENRMSKSILPPPQE